MTDLERLAEKHHKRLRDIHSGVLNVHTGIEVKDGKLTGRPAIVVYVDKKVEKKLLTQKEILPDEIEGVPVDVIQLNGNPGQKWTAGKTSISEMSPMQQKSILGVNTLPKMLRSLIQIKTIDVVTDFSNLFNKIENQWTCGSCTVYGSGGVCEARHNQVYGTLPLLSKQHWFSCDGGTCQGGNDMATTLNFILNNGVALEKDCPTQMGDGVDRACGSGLASDWALRGIIIAGWMPSYGLDQILQILALRPMVTTMTVYPSFFNYVSGIYHTLTNESEAGSHCVGCVGTDTNLKAHKGRNSWDEDWGEKGYFQIAYGDSNFDDFMYDIFPTDVHPTPGPNPDPGPTPVPNPCKFAAAFHAPENFVLKKLGKGKVIYVKR